MATWLALAVYGLVLVPAAGLVWRRPVLALYAWIVGLALHNAVMAALYGAGVRGSSLTAIQAWKEILLAVALARVALDAARSRRLAFRVHVADLLAVAFGAIVCVYAVLPQHFIYNTGSEDHFLRRLVSTFLGPLASAYMFVVALLLGAVFLRRVRLLVPLSLLIAVGLLFTFSRSSLLALAAGLVVLAFI